MENSKAINSYKVTQKRGGEVIFEETVFNDVSIEGFNDLLAVYFKAGTQSPTWYAGLKKAGAFAESDTLGAHPGWVEFLGYAGDRKALALGDPANAQVISDSVTTEFTLEEAADISGVLITNAEVGAPQGGVLYGVAEFSRERSADIGDVFTIQATFGFTN